MIGVSVLAVAVALAGCGGSSGTSAGRPEGGQPQSSSAAAAAGGSAPVPAGTIEVTIPTLLPERFIPRRYTCDGTDTSLPVRWSKVPRGTAELVLFLASLRPTPTFFNWAVAGLGPASRGISAGVLPPGAVVGRNGFGRVAYSICPPKGTVEEHYVLRLEALPRRLAVRPGFDPETLYREAERISKTVGLAGGTYTRR
jgi:phosphatidylethanolamine-binding protein (PEBP) family uncharacterized protein